LTEHDGSGHGEGRLLERDRDRPENRRLALEREATEIFSLLGLLNLCVIVKPSEEKRFGTILFLETELLSRDPSVLLLLVFDPGKKTLPLAGKDLRALQAVQPVRTGSARQ